MPKADKVERPGRIEYLQLTPRQASYKRALDRAIDALDLPPRCRIPKVVEKDGREITTYPHMDYDERVPPDPIAALSMCSTSGRMCGAADQCFDYATALGDVNGVWGGHIFVDGKPQGITNNKEVRNG